MKKILFSAAALAFIAAGLSLPAFSAGKDGDKVIYGADDRLDIYQVTDAKLLKLADSTVGLFQGSDVTINGDKAVLTTDSYSQSYGLCKEEPFYEQVTGAFCSGSLVAPDIIMTAGHCVKTEDACKSTKFVFGFAVTTKGVMPDTLPAGEVYGCSQLIGREQVGTGADWALIRLDRKVTNHAALKYNAKDTVKNGDPLVVIGHPAGLPTKIAGGSTVRDASTKGYFVANLDTYGGNSGSAVFSAKTGVIEGILVRGENDYVYQNGCRVSNVCPSDGCRGEDVTKLSSITSPFSKTDTEVPAEEVRVAKASPAFELLNTLAPEAN
ncbi:MAG: trypsin-like peptidase domain-containing protein [Elusimicrobiota bacterium]|nr:trypsin-like peptidase domain-containing protein [Elusimicrobiota bacterium]